MTARRFRPFLGHMEQRPPLELDLSPELQDGLRYYAALAGALRALEDRGITMPSPRVVHLLIQRGLLRPSATNQLWTITYDGLRVAEALRLTE